MDSGRFGRVLGVGARLAGKTLKDAVEAAAADHPTARERVPTCSMGAVTMPPRSPRESKAVTQARLRLAAVKRGGSHFGDAIWKPFARASGVLWLEVTGVFFGLVAMAGLDGVWLNRAVVHWTTSAADIKLHAATAGVIALTFGYFCLSSFLQARRRSRL